MHDKSFRPLAAMLPVALAFSLGSAVAHGAENLNAAVQELARRIAETSTNADSKQTIAITAFPHSDGTASELSLILVDNLMQALFDIPGSKLTIVERGQLDKAVQEIGLKDTGTIDINSAQELGNMLSAQALVIGSITLVGDEVQLYARMIATQTGHVFASATSWVPFTPSVEKLYQRRVLINGKGEDRRNGIWIGSGQCGDSTVGLALALIWGQDNKVKAMQTYYPFSESGRSMPAGSFRMEGTYNPDGNIVELNPADWIYQPQGHNALGLSGKLNSSQNTITGKFGHEGCQNFTVTLK